MRNYMTFKHLKFGESSTMQAFEKLAQNKGLVKPDAVKKTAAPKTLDLNPSENLLENVLKLAIGLRKQGFHKHADDLEKKFLMFKEADSLYETSKETGEDLVDQAHPKGSHKLEGVEGDAVVETIVDAKKKIEEIANKKPTGKFASNKEVIDAVKKVFAAGTGMEYGMIDLAPKAGGGWTRLLSFLGRAAPASGSIELAGGGAAVGGGAVEGAAVGGAAVGGAALASFAAAVLVGAILGAVVGNALFEHYLAPGELKDAGEKLIEKADALKQQYLNEKGKASLNNFRIAFADVMKNYSAIEEIKKSGNPNNLVKLKALNDKMWLSHKYAMELWGWSQAAADDTWKPRFFTGPSDIVALAKNYMDVCNEITTLIQKFVDETNANLAEKIKQEMAKRGGEGPVNLLKSYDATIAEIDKYIAIVSAKRMNNGKQLTDWLSKVKAAVKGESDKFKAVADKDKGDVVKFYADRLEQKIKPKIQGFKEKWVA